ncbi:putative condensin subunit 1 [Trypanosoma theileri]|uniref:Putative condensin subunit 1 n=1 Tax=Trypanosoma theileri TaxID=67003 RepID=A0A1X0P7S6_9TRYP|nr:putative condensin subunit 1 [Trypanosoma theileri]ORC92992.1 putative condensin subunit 1 [Trypanosoma theileri]
MQRYLMNTTYLQGQLKELHILHNKTVTEYGELVENLFKECNILCDVIPGYKISATLEDEDGAQGGRKQKEVYQVQKLEHEVLAQYEHFLQLLRRLQRKTHPEQQALGSRLCAQLVSHASEFNHADKLLSLAVDFANAKSTRVAQPALKALSELLDGQMVSDATESIVSAILNIVRRQSYAMNPKLLNLLLHIRVALVDIHRRDLTEEKAKNKRLKKEDKELARQMQKSKARRDRAEVAVKQGRILHRVFVIYLRIMEASKSCSQHHQTKILAPTLEGLVKFAPLVNVELYHQLLTALKDLVNDETTSVTTKLHALVAVASLAQRDATAAAGDWRVDLSYFHEVLFRCLIDALDIPKSDTAKAPEEKEDSNDQDDAVSQGSSSSAGSLSSQAFSIANSMAQADFVQSNASREWTFRVGLVLRAVDLLVLTQKHLPISRVTAIVRRITQAIPSCPPHIALALLALNHRLILRYPAVGGIVIGGSDNVIGGRGAYNPMALQTVTSNADSSFTWELSLLTKSYHPTLRHVSEVFCRHFHKLSKYTQGQEPIVTKQLDALGPYEVLESYDPSLGELRPPPPLPEAVKRKKNGTKRGRNDMAEDEKYEN